ncbi:MAG: hypothetical protein HN488_02750 [Saprospiraceae bacterium]|nr:hypothetical protein [Saprospiraceae bacterium]
MISIVGYPIMVILCGEYLPTPLRINLNSREGIDNNILKKIEDLEDVNNLDVLFLGSSHAYRSFDPRIWDTYGYTTFNLGTSSQTHIHSGLLLKEYIPRIKPSLVVYEVYPDMFSNNGVESNTVFLSFNICYDQMKDVVLKNINVKTINEYIYASYRRWKYPKENILIELDTTLKIYRSRGFVENKSSSFTEVNNYKRGKMLESQISAFRANLFYLKNLNIPYVLLQAPVTSIEQGRFPDKEKYDQLMSEYDNHVDYSQLYELKDSIHFYDYHHMNQKGVEIFNPIFIKKLQDSDLLEAQLED